MFPDFHRREVRSTCGPRGVAVIRSAKFLPSLIAIDKGSYLVDPCPTRVCQALLEATFRCLLNFPKLDCGRGYLHFSLIFAEITTRTGDTPSRAAPFVGYAPE